jgi:predicted peroxiredoxin
VDDDKVLIVMTSGPDTPRRCATPFFFAQLAAVMEFEVTMFFTIDGVLLLKEGLADEVYPKAGGKAVGEFLRDALESGVEFTACSAATELHGLEVSDLIDEVEMAGGAAMWEMAEESKIVLTF